MLQIQNQKYSLAEALQNLSRRNTDKGREDQVQKNLSVFILSHIFSSVHAPGYSLGFFYIPSEDSMTQGRIFSLVLTTKVVLFPVSHGNYQCFLILM